MKIYVPCFVKAFIAWLGKRQYRIELPSVEGRVFSAIRRGGATGFTLAELRHHLDMSWATLKPALDYLNERRLIKIEPHHRYCELEVITLA